MQHTVEVRLPLFIFKDEFGYFSAFCPALKVAGQGLDEKSAIASFEQVVEIFLEETVRKGTLHGILKDLGWTYKSHNKPKPPSHTDIPEYLFSHKEVSIPVPIY